MSSPQVVRQAYSTLAQPYIDLLGTMDAVHPDDQRLIEHHLGRANGPVLDLGCGPGHLTNFLCSAGADVTGIDLVPEFVAHARQAHPAARFQVGAMTETGRPDGSVAGVLAWYSLIHLDPRQVGDALCVIRRLLQPGGTLVLGFFDGPALEPFAHKVTTAYRWPVDEVAAWLAATGFAEIERLQRGWDGERGPHAAIAARGV